MLSFAYERNLGISFETLPRRLFLSISLAGYSPQNGDAGRWRQRMKGTRAEATAEPRSIPS